MSLLSVSPCFILKLQGQKRAPAMLENNTVAHFSHIVFNYKFTFGLDRSRLIEVGIYRRKPKGGRLKVKENGFNKTWEVSKVNARCSGPEHITLYKGQNLMGYNKIQWEKKRRKKENGIRQTNRNCLCVFWSRFSESQAARAVKVT